MKNFSVAYAFKLFGLTATVAKAQPAGEADQYADLIPQFGQKALIWAKAQTDTTRTKLEASPNFKAVLDDMRAVHARRHPLPDYDLLGLRCGPRRLRRLRQDSA